mgnify:FL=1
MTDIGTVGFGRVDIVPDFDAFAATFRTRIQPLIAQLVGQIRAVDTALISATRSASALGSALTATGAAAQATNLALDAIDSRDVTAVAGAATAASTALDSMTASALAADAALTGIDGRRIGGVTVQATQASGSLATMGASAQAAGTVGGGSMSRFGASIGALANPLTMAGAGFGAVALGSFAAARAAIDFESAFTGVLKTVDGTQEQLDALRQNIIDMSLELPATTTEIASVAEAAGQLGIETSNIAEFTKVMIDLGETTNLAATDAASALARIANITQLPQDQFDRLGSTIVDLGNNLATTEAEMTQMALRIAGAGTTVGLTEDQIVSFAAALSSVGIRAEAGGSAISRTFIDIASAVSAGGDDLELFATIAGQSSDQFRQAFGEDAATATLTFIEGLGKMEEETGGVFAALEELGLAEIRQRDALLRAASAGDLFRDALALGSKAWRENTALAEEANLRYGTVASQLDVLRNQATEAFRSFGERLLPTVVRLGEAVLPIVKQMALVLEGISGPLFGLLTPILEVFDVLTESASFISEAFVGLGGVLGDAFRAILSPIQILTPLFNALGKVIATVVNVVSSLVAAFQPVIEAASDLISTVLTPILPLFDGLALAVDAVGKVLVWLIDHAVKPFTEALGKVIEVTAAVVSGVAAWIWSSEQAGEQSEYVALTQEEMASEIEQATSALYGQVSSLSQLAEVMGNAAVGFGEFIRSQSQFADQDLLDPILDSGLAIDQLRDQLARGNDGLKDFIASMIEADKIDLTIDGVEQSGADIRALNGSIVELLNTEGTAVRTGGDLVRAFIDTGNAIDGANRETLRALRLNDQLTTAQLNAAIAIAEQNDGIARAAEVLDIVSTRMDEVNDVASQTDKTLLSSTERAGAMTDALLSLSEAAISTGVDTADLIVMAQRFGLSMDELKDYVDNVADAFADFQNELTKGLPDVGQVVDDAFSDITQATAPDEIIANLEEQQKALIDYQSNIAILMAFGFDDIARLAASRGPEFTNALVDTLTKGRPELKFELERQLEQYQVTFAQVTEFIQTEAAPSLFDATAAAGAASTAALGETLDFGGVLTSQTQSVVETSTPILDAFRSLGASLAGSLSGSYSAGVAIPDVTGQAMGDAQGAVVGAVPGLEAESATAGAATAASFEGALDLAGATDEAGAKADAALNALGLSGSALAQSAEAAGRLLAFNFLAGIAIEFGEQSGPGGLIHNATVNLIRDIERIAREASESQSPSKLFARVGADLLAGLDMGIAAETPTVVASMTHTLGALDPFAGAPGGVPPTAGAAPLAASGDVYHIEVRPTYSEGMTVDDATRLGEAEGDEIARVLAARRIVRSA